VHCEVYLDINYITGELQIDKGKAVIAHQNPKTRRGGRYKCNLDQHRHVFIRLFFSLFWYPVFVRIPILPTQGINRVAAKKDKSEPRRDETGLLIISLQARIRVTLLSHIRRIEQRVFVERRSRPSYFAYRESINTIEEQEADKK
jgi:hypothetical protein